MKHESIPDPTASLAFEVKLVWPNACAAGPDLSGRPARHADHHVGRIIDELSDLKILDDTLVYYIIGDNGASAEGSLIGAWNDKTGAEAPDLATPQLLIERMWFFAPPNACTRLPCFAPVS